MSTLALFRTISPTGNVAGRYAKFLTAAKAFNLNLIDPALSLAGRRTISLVLRVGYKLLAAMLAGLSRTGIAGIEALPRTKSLFGMDTRDK
jgi:hypothetical protein